jgi:hypothetical protein
MRSLACYLGYIPLLACSSVIIDDLPYGGFGISSDLCTLIHKQTNPQPRPRSSTGKGEVEIDTEDKERIIVQKPNSST